MRVMMSDVEMPSVLWVGANMPEVGENNPGQLEQDINGKKLLSPLLGNNFSCQDLTS